MRFAGIDVGSLTAQAVLIVDGTTPMLKSIGTKILSRSIRVRSDPLDSAREVMGELLEENNLAWGDITRCISTGYGRDRIVNEGLAGQNVSEITCHGVGAFSLAPRVRTIIDIGGQDAKVIRMDEQGELVDFVMNDKCAAGTGRFLEVMSRTLGIGYQELGPIARTARGTVELSARCSIFAETEVLHYLQKGAERAFIASGITRSMAERVMALVRRVGFEREVAMTGGVAKNVAVRHELERMMNLRMLIPGMDPQLIGAYGAAIIARRRGAGE